MLAVFPLNYLRTLFSPILSFKNRHYLKLWQIVLIILFLTGLLLSPMSFRLGRLSNVNLMDYTPNAMQLVDHSMVTAVNQLEETEQGYAIDDHQVIQSGESGVVAFFSDNTAAKEAVESQGGIMFTPTQFFIQEPEKPLINQAYLNDSAIQDVTNPEELIAELSRQWFAKNRLAIILTNFINIWILMITSSLILWLGSSFFISLMRFSDRNSIRTFKESLQLCLNCLGLPTLIASLIGVVSGSPTTMLSAQGIGFVLMLIWVYWKTQFQDQHVAKLEAEASLRKTN